MKGSVFVIIDLGFFRNNIDALARELAATKPDSQNIYEYIADTYFSKFGKQALAETHPQLLLKLRSDGASKWYLEQCLDFFIRKEEDYQKLLTRLTSTKCKYSRAAINVRIDRHNVMFTEVAPHAYMNWYDDGVLEILPEEYWSDAITDYVNEQYAAKKVAQEKLAADTPNLFTSDEIDELLGESAATEVFERTDYYRDNTTYDNSSCYPTDDSSGTSYSDTSSTSYSDTSSSSFDSSCSSF
ncbi:hypothetical protein [Pseudoalteromonas phage J2-1_QLiu-2017]|nr:hypothetical protein [Pseudoalteromonas phage J2-1_QLiu-2017]